jgi:hypothetical protein
MPRGLDRATQTLATSDHTSGTQSRANRRPANPGRVRPEPLVAISWNDWSPSAGTAGRNRWNTQLREETAASRRSREFEPDMEERFAQLLKCTNCGEIVAVYGTIAQEPYYDADDALDFTDSFGVKGAHPSPLPIRIDRKIPKEIGQHLRSAAELYWNCPEAAANKLRQSVEQFLNHQGIPRKTRSTKTGLLEPMSLHSRIIRYQVKEEELGELLLAVKWIGNDGSHLGQVTDDQLLDGFEMIHHVLEETYVKTLANLSKKAKQIIRSKKRRKRRKTVVKVVPPA